MTLNNAYEDIRSILDDARTQAYKAVNTLMVKAYWEIGRVIVEEEQEGKERAKYGNRLIAELSLKLIKDYGKGFTERNLWNMKQFYSLFPKLHAVRAELSWTHYRLLLRVENDNARNFYMHETVNSQWSTRELERQINSLLYERIALSRDKKGVLELSKKGQVIEKAKDLVKDPYVLEFLGLEDRYTEKELEQNIINRLQKFLLELGKGFAFVSRQFRIVLEDEHFFADLVFYNRLLKCFVIIELKIGKMTHKDLGQLQMYVNYFDRDVKKDDENKTIGILLCTDKKDSVIKYTLPEDNRQIFASKYKLYLPSEEELKREVRKSL